MTDFDLMTITNSITHSPLVETLGWSLFHSVWQLALIAIAIKLLMMLISQRFSTTRYAIALTGLCLSAMIPMVTFGLIEPTAQLPVVNVGEFAIADTAFALAAERSFADVVVEPQNWSEVARDRIGPWLPLLTTGWILGVFLFSIRPAFGILTVSKMKRTGTSTVSSAVDEQFRKLIETMQINRPIQLMQSTMTAVPMVVGFFKPMVLVPASTLTNLSAHELQAVLAHELAHLRRYDDYVNLGQTIVESVFFYHPCVWWMSSLVRAERENCCDDVAVSVVGGPKPLAQALLQLENTRVAEPALSATGGSLVKRIRRLTPDSKPKFNSRRHGNPWVYCVTCATLLLVTGFFGFVVERRVDAVAPPTTQDVKQDDDTDATIHDSVLDLINIKSLGDKEKTAANFVETVGLQHRDADAIADSVSSMFSGTSGMGVLEISLDESNKVLVLQASKKSGLGYAKRLIKLFDVPRKTFKPIESGKIPRVASFQIKHRKADQLVSFLEEYYKDQTPKLKIRSVSKTNSIVVVTKKSVIEETKTLISMLDKAAQTKNLKRVEKVEDLESNAPNSDETKPTIRISPLYLAYVEVGKLLTINAEFAVAEMLIDEPETANIILRDRNTIRVKGLKPGVVFFETKSANEETIRYRIYVVESKQVNNNLFRQLQSKYFTERKEIDKLAQEGALSLAIKRSESLRQTILEESRLDEKSKSALIEISENDIRGLNVELGIRKNGTRVESERVVISMEPGNAIFFEADFDIAEIVLSTNDIVDYLTLNRKEIRVWAKADVTGTCELDLVDRNGKARRRYRFEVGKLKAEK